MSGNTERLFVQLEARVNQFEKNMAKAERKGTKTYQSLERGSRRTSRRMEGDMNRSTRAINRALQSTTTQVTLFSKAFAAAFVGAGLTGFTASVRRSVAELSEMAKVIDRVGLSSDVFQELQYGFELAGVAQNDFVTGMEQFTRRIGEASMGTGRLRDILDANGVALRDQNGQMRSNEDLLRNYADLIANAGSEQEQMTLATEAFGRGGASFVNALKNGSVGFDDMADAAANAGGTIDKTVLDKAEDLDDRFAGIARTVNNRFKTAMVGVADVSVTAADAIAKTVTSLEDSAGALADWLVTAEQARGFVEWFQRNMPAITPNDLTWIEDNQLPGETRTTPKTSRLRLQPGKTVLPGDDDDGDGGRARTRNAAAEAALREAKAVADLIDELEFELSLIGMADVERENAIKQRQAGSAATLEQRRQISQLVDKIHEERAAIEASTEALEARNDAIEHLFDSGMNALDDIISGADNAGDAFLGLAADIAKAAAQAALFNSGPLAGLFGGAGGLLSAGFGAPVDPWAGLRIPSFDGGGFTGYGPRSGGIDGRGGMPAIVHPNETIIDHTKRSQQPAAQPITYAPVYHFTGTQAELDEFRRAAAQDRAQFDAKVIGVIRNSKYQRHLRG